MHVLRWWFLSWKSGEQKVLVCADTDWAGSDMTAAGCSPGVVVTLTSGQESHRKPTWERRDMGIVGSRF